MNEMKKQTFLIPKFDFARIEEYENDQDGC